MIYHLSQQSFHRGSPSNRKVPQKRGEVINMHVILRRLMHPVLPFEHLSVLIIFEQQYNALL